MYNLDIMYYELQDNLLYCYQCPCCYCFYNTTVIYCQLDNLNIGTSIISVSTYYVTLQ